MEEISVFAYYEQLTIMNVWRVSEWVIICFRLDQQAGFFL